MSGTDDESYNDWFMFLLSVAGTRGGGPPFEKDKRMRKQTTLLCIVLTKSKYNN